MFKIIYDMKKNQHFKTSGENKRSFKNDLFCSYDMVYMIPLKAFKFSLILKLSSFLLIHHLITFVPVSHYCIELIQ